MSEPAPEPLTPLLVGNVDREYSEIAREDPTCLYLVVNGALEPAMGPGKIAAQTFQAAMWLFTHPEIGEEQRDALAAWQAEGARTVVRIARTPALWERVKNEVPGVLLLDEGLTEVAHGAETVFCAWPTRRSAASRLFSHKKIPLLT
jgi:peptidyl-tRNA hydrolase